MKTVKRPDILQRCKALKLWQRGDERAPHKPLLALLALAPYTCGERVVRFVEYEGKLTQLLRDYGSERRTLYPEMPFVRLQEDHVWQVATHGAPDAVPPGALDQDRIAQPQRNRHFSGDVQRAFDRDPQAPTVVARMLLDAHSPESMHDDIPASVGLTLNAPDARKPRRSQELRDRVLLAYQ